MHDLIILNVGLIGNGLGYLLNTRLKRCELCSWGFLLKDRDSLFPHLQYHSQLQSADVPDPVLARPLSYTLSL